VDGAVEKIDAVGSVKSLNSNLYCRVYLSCGSSTSISQTKKPAKKSAGFFELTIFQLQQQATQVADYTNQISHKAACISAIHRTVIVRQ
jgi:hypothetical protein